MRKLALCLLLGYTLSGCVESVNVPILDNSYDATTATKPYKNQGESLPDCRLGKKDGVDGCLYYGKKGVLK